MTDYMLTVVGKLGARDIEVDNAETMREAITIAERATGCPVDHGRGGILSEWDPAWIIDATTGNIIKRHDQEAIVSMQIVNHAAAAGVRVAKGEGA